MEKALFHTHGEMFYRFFTGIRKANSLKRLNRRAFIRKSQQDAVIFQILRAVIYG